MERAKLRGKCDESLYEHDESFFESLKAQYPDVDFDQLCEQHANSQQSGSMADVCSVDNGRTSSISGSGE